ncbi:MAG: OmpA family protein [Leptonema illini]|uniref:OmpA family protein n=1 Tax=Leptonema illini TaxID=183 RepID=A0A833LXS0_9LEPT|nr:MAG: OmpA family protein [Leptonema illini]
MGAGLPSSLLADPLQQDTPFQGRFLHRILFSVGSGYATGKQNVMTESGQAWMINSVLNSANSAQPVVLPAGEGQGSRYFPDRTILGYSYGDRFDVNYRRSTVDQKFDRSGSPAVLFLYPGNATYATSLFEGVRLMRFRHDSRFYEFGYFHRWTDKLRAGPVVAYHTYIEDLLISYGSYTLRSSAAATDPGLLTWAQGGDARLKYDMKGTAFGAGLKWDPLNNFRLTYHLYLINRSGNVSGGGYQLIQDRNQSGIESSRIEGLYQMGSASDKGMMHRVEAEYNYCRWSIAMGLERESWKRSYSSFNFLSNQSRDVSSKGNLIGLGEMSASSEGYRTELYLRVGVSAYFGDVAAPVIKKQEVVEEKAPEPAKKEEVAPESGVTDESSKYLNNVFDSIQKDYNEQGEVLEQTEKSFRALGIEVKKEVNEKGQTVNLQATIDGDISFKTGSAELTPKALEVVDKFGDAMNANPNTVSRVHGHTDTPGSKEGNRRLSQRRAESVRTALIQRKGIAASRILEVKGFADDRKIVQTNASEPRNRRTVIIIEYRK